MTGHSLCNCNAPSMACPNLESSGTSTSPISCVCHQLTATNPVSFLGLNIELRPGHRVFVSQPGYTAAILSNFPRKNSNVRARSSPLPPEMGDDSSMAHTVPNRSLLCSRP
mmetsp:Transcript_17112/g.23521  ORF Transcript_17112/g.23521 Transcript_17112/m.23521 type:complete len:111 (-) Transcript_17112:117-449(-)